MSFQFWQPPYGTDLDPLEAKGEEQARRFAQNFKLYEDRGFEGALKQVQIVSQAQGTTMWRQHSSFFCKMIDVREQSHSFGTMFDVGERLWELNMRFGIEGAMWLILHSLVLMKDKDFDHMLQLGSKLQFRFDTDTTIEKIVQAARDRD
jgi:hypothetical protein